MSTHDVQLDELDRRIIDLLTRDARVSNRQVATQLGVTEGTIRGRIRRLEKERDEALKALESFNPWRIGYGPSLNHDALNTAWRNAEAILTPKPKEPTK